MLLCLSAQQEIEELSMLSEHYSPNYSFLCRRLSTRVFVKYILEERMQGKVPEKVRVGHITGHITEHIMCRVLPHWVVVVFSSPRSSEKGTVDIDNMILSCFDF